MIKGTKRNIRLIILYVIIIVLMGVFMPRQLDWSPSFSKYHNTPYGAEAIHENIKDLFSKEKVLIADEPLYNLLKDTSISNTNYIFLNSSFYVDSLDKSALFTFAGAGNNVFISAESFDDKFLDSLDVTTETHLNNFANVNELDGGISQLEIRDSDEVYEFKAQWVNTYFIRRNSSELEHSGIGWQDSLYNYIKIPYKSGNFYLHCFPYALTNYYLMKEENRSYISSVFSQLPQDYDLIWDEYYKPHRSAVQQSPLSVLMRYEAFRWAYWLTISGVVLFMIFYAKRKQRAIPVIEPPRNESVNFVRTLGSLYYNKGNNKDIFEKKIQVFKEHLYSQFFMKDISFSQAEAEKLKLKSGAKKEVIDRIFQLENEFRGLSEISDAQLKAIVKKINEFYNQGETT